MNKILLILSCIVAVAADMLFVWWAKKDSHPTWSFIVGIILLNIATLVWMYTMRKGIESATAITFYALFTVAGCSFLGFMVFKETLSLVNSIGLALAFVSLIMISI
jgi:multidrug transporter EmrE-like cation transporter